MWDFFLGIVTTCFIFFVCSRQRESDLVSFLRKTKIVPVKQLKQIKAKEKQIQINRLKEQNLITAEQEKLLLTKCTHLSQPFALKKLKKQIAFGGIFCILAGIIALIAANWQEIPAWFKLVIYFAVLLGLNICFVTLFKRQKKNEGFLWFNIGWIFSGVALIEQVFYLNSSVWDTIFTGTLLSTPFVVVSQLKGALTLWSLSYGTAAIYSSAFEWAYLLILAVFPVLIYFKNEKLPAFIWIFSFIFSLLKTSWFNQLAKSFIDTFMPSAAAWVFLSLLFSMVCIIRYMLGKNALTKAFFTVFYIICFCTLLGVDYTYSINDVSLMPETVFRSVFFVFILAVLPFAAVCLFWEHKKNALVLWTVSLTLSLIYIFVKIQTGGFILLLIVLSVAALFFAGKRKGKSFYACLILMTVRIGLQYFVFTVSLPAVGMGLIGIGILLLGGSRILALSDKRRIA